MHEIGPPYWNRQFGFWVVTRYTDTLTALRTPTLRADDPLRWLDRLSEKSSTNLDNLRKVVSTISFYMDEPRHDAVRRYLAQLFQSLDLTDLRTQLETRAIALIDAKRTTGSIDLATDYARDLALFTIHRILEIPFADCLALAAMARDVAAFFDLAPRLPRQFAEADHRLGDLLAYFDALIADRRRTPRDDRISLMIDLAEKHLGTTDTDLSGYCAFFFVAGEETTGTGIAASSVTLLQRPDLLTRLANEPGRIPDAAQELLRLASPFQYVTRIASADLLLGGQPIQKGQLVQLILAAANRDPEIFPDPDTIDIDRISREPIPFGYGAYRCLGARMATIELEVAIAALTRNPDVHLGPEPVTWEPRTRVPALASAPASFRQAKAPPAT